MGARLGSPSGGFGGRRRGGDDDLAEVHEINVTPFIDVMLVLLIIFMVAAPLATVDLGVDLPASAVEPQPRPDKPVFVTVKPDLTIAVGEDIIPRDTMPTIMIDRAPATAAPETQPLDIAPGPDMQQAEAPSEPPPAPVQQSQ